MLLKNCALVIKKIRKWSEMSLFTIPVELSVLTKSLVKIWSIRVALVLVILVSLFVTGVKKFWKDRLKKPFTFVLVLSRKFYITRNNNKVDSTETGRIVIAHLLP